MTALTHHSNWCVMAAQSRQKTRAGLAKVPRRTMPLPKAGQLLKGRAWDHILPAVPGKTFICLQIGIQLPYPQTLTLPSVVYPTTMVETEEERANTSKQVLPLF
jgi:hypothetical protein